MSQLRNVLLSLLKLPVKLLVKPHAIPTDVESELGIDPNKPLVYLLPSNSLTDQLTLSIATKKLGLPSPTDMLEVKGRAYPKSMFLRRTPGVLFARDRATDIEAMFTELFHLHREHDDINIQFVPVFISWGRAPGKGKPGFADLVSDKTATSWLRKLFIVLFLGRDNFVSLSRAVSSRMMADERCTDELSAQKVIRLASTHFYRKQQALTGPTLLERKALYNAVLGSDAVKRALEEEAKNKKVSSDVAKKRALEYIDEVAADYREGLIRVGDRLLTRIWNKIYNGIRVGHADRIRELARNGHEIIYVPCHRSHMDYLLLTYVIYHEGMVTPHIAAGINLNFWPVGKIFRRGGAFFLRRSFAGNKLYTAVFREYLELLFNRGYSVKYYPEGGRSRTGRLLPPKTGMLAMTLQALTKNVHRPVSIVPVYIGYENVMEVKSYQNELKGKSKKKESNWQVFSAIRKLKNYGYGYVNFGEPIHVNQFLDKQVKDWRNNLPSDPDKKPTWLTPTVNELAQRVMERINGNAAVNSMALASLCLLSSKNTTMSRKELSGAFRDFTQVLRDVPYSEDMTLPDEHPEDMLQHVLKLNRLEVEANEYGELIKPLKGSAVFLTYYRNNILHLYALPGIIAAAVFAQNRIAKTDVLQLVAALYPLIQRELFMYMSQDEALAYTYKLIASMVSNGLLQEQGDDLLRPEADSPTFHSAWLLSRCMQETFQRYAVVLTLIAKLGEVSRGKLEKMSRQVAERLSTLYGMSSPEFYDKSVLAVFIAALRENHWLDSTSDGALKYSQESEALRKDVLALVWPEITQHLVELDISE